MAEGDMVRFVVEFVSRCVQAEQQRTLDADELRLRTAEALEQAMRLIPGAEMADGVLRSR